MQKDKEGLADAGARDGAVYLLMYVHSSLRQAGEMAKAACRVVLTFLKGDVCIISMLWVKLQLGLQLRAIFISD